MTLRTSHNFLQICIATSVLLTSLSVSISSYANQDELKGGVKSEISRQQTSVSKQQKELNTLQQSLKKQELSISSWTGN